MYTITRIEKVKDSTNTVKEIFFAMEIMDDDGTTYNFGKWLSSSQVALVLSDETKMNTIAQSYLAAAKQNYLNSLEAVEPPIVN